MIDYRIYTKARGELPMLMEVFTDPADTKHYVSAIIEGNDGKLSKSGRTGTFFDPERETNVSVYYILSPRDEAETFFPEFEIMLPIRP